MRHIFVENEDGVLACEACGQIYDLPLDGCCEGKKCILDDEFKGCPEDED